MNVIVMGCGRVGASVAGQLSEDGHDVSVIDTDPFAFSRLPTNFAGRRITGSGNDFRILETINIKEADVFIAVASGDNRNLLASQRAKHQFGIKNVITRVKDPQRSVLFQQLGLSTFSPTKNGSELIVATLLQETPVKITGQSQG